MSTEGDSPSPARPRPFTSPKGASELAHERLRQAEQRVGTCIGEWQLNALLGVGGSSAVFAAAHHDGRQSAIKVLHRDIARSAEARRRLLREAKLVNRVRHPGVVAVLDAGREPGGADFLVLELLDGQSLEELCERRGGTLPESEAMGICEHVVDILEAAHAAGIVHRDIKPSNIFVTSCGSIRLLDFGVARGDVEGDDDSSSERGATIGTLRFMAPEQARGHSGHVGPHTDLWAVGATLFRLISGRHVHHNRTGSDLLITVATTPAPSLRRARPGVSLAVAALVDRALAFDPARRFRSAREMQRALSAAMGQCGSLAAIALELGSKPVNDDETSRWGVPDLHVSAAPRPAAWRRFGLATAVLVASFTLVAPNLSVRAAAFDEESLSPARSDPAGVPLDAVESSDDDFAPTPLLFALPAASAFAEEATVAEDLSLLPASETAAEMPTSNEAP